MLDGDKITSKSYLKDVVEKESAFNRRAHRLHDLRGVYYDQTGANIGKRSDTYMRADRNKTRDTSKYKEQDQLATWTPEDIERFQQEYRARSGATEAFLGGRQGRRRARQGDQGPAHRTGEIAFESFFGMYLVGNIVASQLLDKHPMLMVPNEQGVPEPPQRVHWDNRFTQQTLGLAGAYDLGIERLSWLCHAAQNWIGDKGFLSSSTLATRSSTTWATSPGRPAGDREVRARRQEDGQARPVDDQPPRPDHRDRGRGGGAREPERSLARRRGERGGPVVDRTLGAVGDEVRIPARERAEGEPAGERAAVEPRGGDRFSRSGRSASAKRSAYPGRCPPCAT